MTAGNHPATSRQASPAAYLRRLRRLHSAIPDLPLPGSGFGTQSARPADGGQGAVAAAEAKRAEPKTSSRKSENYYDIKSTIFNALIDAIDLTQLGQLDRDAARDEIRDIVNEIITLKDVVMSIAEQEELLEDICNDVLGLWSARAAAGPRRHCRHHGQRRQHDLHRSRRQDAEDGRALPRQCPAAQHLPAHRQPDRPPRRRSQPDLRRPPAWTARASTSSCRHWRSMDPTLTIRKFKKDRLKLPDLVQLQLDHARKAPPFSRSSAGCAATC